MKTHNLRLIVFAIEFLLNASFSIGAESDAVVKLSTKCSGVCVTSSGIVITVKHCDTPRSVTVEFTGRKVTANLLHVPSGWDGCVVYQCEAGTYPFAVVSQRTLATGDLVHSFGYSGSDRKNLVTMRGKLTGATTVFQGPSKRIAVNTTDFQSMHGMSGGPLFNSSGEVIGLLSTAGRTDSQFIQLKDIRSSLVAASPVIPERGSSGRKILYAFVPGGT